MQGSPSSENSIFIAERRRYVPSVPHLMRQVNRCCLSEEMASSSVDPTVATLFPHTANQPLISLRENPTQPPVELRNHHGNNGSKPPCRVGVVFSGGQAPGGHNVVCGLWSGLQQFHKDSTLIGFIGGPDGILKNRTIAITDELAQTYRNTGGFDLLGTGRTKLESNDCFETCAAVFDSHELDAVVIIGGDDSNTNAAFLAEYLSSVNHRTRVVGVPKTIDSDLRGKFTGTSFGFDTAVRVYSELISNIAKDSMSGGKYYHFVRLMGRSASHITLEAALQTRPTMALVSEEIAQQGATLRDIVDIIANTIRARAETGLNHGVILVPEGLIEFVPEMKELISDLNEIIASHKQYMDSLRGFTAQIEYLAGRLPRNSAATLAGLPIDIQRQLLMDRDPHGNVALSRVETEKLLIELVAIKLGELKSEGNYCGKFAWQTHFFGYEGRCAAPTNFDANYAWNLGLVAAALCHDNAPRTGYLAAVHDVAGPINCWQGWGVPLVSMLTMERRGGKTKAVIKKTLVDLQGGAFREFARWRDDWAKTDRFLFCGPIQYFGPPSITEQIPLSLALR